MRIQRDMHHAGGMHHGGENGGDEKNKELPLNESPSNMTVNSHPESLPNPNRLPVQPSPCHLRPPLHNVEIAQSEHEDTGSGHNLSSDATAGLSVAIASARSKSKDRCCSIWHGVQVLWLGIQKILLSICEMLADLAYSCTCYLKPRRGIVRLLIVLACLILAFLFFGLPALMYYYYSPATLPFNRNIFN